MTDLRSGKKYAHSYFLTADRVTSCLFIPVEVQGSSKIVEFLLVGKS